MQRQQITAYYKLLFIYSTNRNFHSNKAESTEQHIRKTTITWCFNRITVYFITKPNFTTRNNIELPADTSSSVTFKGVWLKKHEPGCPKKNSNKPDDRRSVSVSHSATGSCLSAAWMTSDPTAECCNLEAIRRGGWLAWLASWAKIDSWEMLEHLVKDTKTLQKFTAHGSCIYISWWPAKMKRNSPKGSLSWLHVTRVREGRASLSGNLSIFKSIPQMCFTALDRESD